MNKREDIFENSEESRRFLDRNHVEGSSSKQHKEMLGTDIPEGYFKNSKTRILDLVKEEAPKKEKLIRLQPRLRYAVAASIAVLLSVTIWFQIEGGIDATEIDALADDALINSLLIDDTDIDAFANDILVSEVMVKAEISEQNIENVFMNSLFVEDSLIDNYMGKSLLENIIL